MLLNLYRLVPKLCKSLSIVRKPVAIYVLSDPLNESMGRYKIGHHTGNIKKLISRYLTPIPEVKIHCFVPTRSALNIESAFKKTFKDRRIRNSNGNLSEWYNFAEQNHVGVPHQYAMPLSNIIEKLKKF